MYYRHEYRLFPVLFPLFDRDRTTGKLSFGLIMEPDQRLTPLLAPTDIHRTPTEFSAGYASYDDTHDKARPLRLYFNIVYKRLPLIVAITILGTAAVSFYSFRQSSVYQAEARLIIEPRKPQVTLKDAINISLGDDQKYNATQLQLLRDPELMKRVVIALGLHTEPNLFGEHERGIIVRLRNAFPAASTAAEMGPAPAEVIAPAAVTDDSAQLALTLDEARRVRTYSKILLDGYQVEQVTGTNIINVTVQDPSPELAVKVAYRTAELFIEENARLETAGAEKAYENLGVSIQDLKAAIARQETAFIDDMRASGLPLQDKGQDLAASRLQGMSEAWLRSMEHRRQLEARYNAAMAANSRGQGMNIPDLHENKIFQDTSRQNTERRTKLQDQIREIEKQIREAETQRSALLVTYTPEYIKVKEKTETIVALIAAKAKTEKEVSKTIDRDQAKFEKDAVSGSLVALRSQLDAGRVQESEAQAAYELEASRANVQGQTQTRLTTLKREIETNRGLLDIYTQRQKEQELALATGRPNNIKIQNRAVTPDEPIGPNRSRNILIAFLFSLAGGVGLAFLLDHLDDSVRTSDDVVRHLGLPTLALIPQYVNTDIRKLLPRSKNGTGDAPAALVTIEERHSPMAEAYRHLRTSLLFSSAGKPPQIILVTSAQQSEGKTTTAINTAITLAQSDADVVIIDCDLRRPRLHSHFGVSNTRGLTNYLSGDKNTGDLVRIYRDLPRLKIITSGPIPPNPAELLSSNEMRVLLRILAAKYKHVIIDSPPGISFTDAAILSTLADGVVLVAMANKSSIHLMRQFKHRVTNIGARIYGIVLNGIKSGSSDYDHYGTEYYQHYCSDDDEPDKAA